MNNFFLKLKDSVDIFEKTKRLLNKDSKSILYKGINYDETKYLSLKEILLFVERDICLAIENGELPSLKAKFEISKEEGQDYISITLFEVKISDFYDIEGRSLSLSDVLSIFCDQGSFKRKLCGHITKKVGQILWSYNRLKMFSVSSNKFRFKYKVQVKLDGIKDPSISCEKADKLFSPYFEKIAKENEKLYGDDSILPHAFPYLD